MVSTGTLSSAGGLLEGGGEGEGGCLLLTLIYTNILDPETNMETHRNERAEGPLDYPITDEGIIF